MSKISATAAAAVLLAGFMLLAAGAYLPAAEKTGTDPGYNIRLNATEIELVFPDGSVFYVPRNLKGKSLKGVHASGGMAQELLDQALSQLGLNQKTSLPKAFSLSQNSPNPFNPSTTISYTIPEGFAKLPVKLNVYNIRGQLVRTLVDQTQGAGAYSVNWDGSDSHGRRVSSGVYFYRLVAGDFVSTRKMVVLK